MVALGGDPVIVLVMIALCLAVLLRGWPLLSAGGAGLGRAVAWWCSGGLGLQMARCQLDRLDLAWRLADLQRKSDAEWARVSRFLQPREFCVTCGLPVPGGGHREDCIGTRLA